MCSAKKRKGLEDNRPLTLIDTTLFGGESGTGHQTNKFIQNNELQLIILTFITRIYRTY